MRIVLGLTRLTPSVCPHAVPTAHRSRPARGKDQSSALLRAKECGILDRLSIVLPASHSLPAACGRCQALLRSLTKTLGCQGDGFSGTMPLSTHLLLALTMLPGLTASERRVQETDGSRESHDTDRVAPSGAHGAERARRPGRAAGGHRRRVDSPRH